MLHVSLSEKVYQVMAGHGGFTLAAYSAGGLRRIRERAIAILAQTNVRIVNSHDDFQVGLPHCFGIFEATTHAIRRASILVGEPMKRPGTGFGSFGPCGLNPVFGHTEHLRIRCQILRISRRSSSPSPLLACELLACEKTRANLKEFSIAA